MVKEIRLLQERVHIGKGAGRGTDAGYECKDIKTEVLVTKKSKGIEGREIIIGPLARNSEEVGMRRRDMGATGLGKLEVDFINMPVSVANGLRRILLSELPTIAIEKAFIIENNGVIYDEHLASRLGLIPIACDPNLMKYRDTNELHETNTIIFELVAEGPMKVTSGDLKWKPQGEQFNVHSYGVRPVYDDILITELAKGQRIRVELHCQKGIGREHAKWSPVSTATYRLHPEIKLRGPVRGSMAKKLQGCFPPGTIELRRIPTEEEVEAFVNNSRKDTGTREALRHEEFQDLVSIERIPGHYIFSVESVGAISADRLLMDGMDYILDKCDVLEEEFRNLATEQGIMGSRGP